MAVKLMTTRKRASDTNDHNGYKKRSLIDFKTAMLIIAALTGGGMADLGVTFVKQNTVASNKIIIDKIDTKLDNYIQAHSKEEQLMDQKLNIILTDIKEDIQEIKTDMKKLRNGNK